jgi:hypothetical protein
MEGSVSVQVITDPDPGRLKNKVRDQEQGFSYAKFLGGATDP